MSWHKTGDPDRENPGESELSPDWWWDLDHEDFEERFPTPERDEYPGPFSWDIEYALAPERVIAAGIVVVFTIAVLTILGVPAALPNRALLSVVYVGLWVFLAIYLAPTAVWGYEAVRSWRYAPPPVEYGPKSVQVRILTVDAADVVQNTVDHLPDALADRHVVAEKPMQIDGAIVHVVPDDFTCAATDKGRALEWARRTIDCEKEFVLFLDEDTLVTEFPGLPDAELVQFREWPMYTGSYLTYWSEVLRMGYQTEQTGFEAFDVPLYAWGGGIAVRKETEDLVTWDFDTLIEDTVFAWLATREGADFEVMDTTFRNQAPPSVWAMLKQRRRWLFGTLREETFLPPWFKALDTVRNVSWAFSPVTPFLLLFSALVPRTMPGRTTFVALAWGLFLFSLVWVYRGWRYYDGPSLHTLPVFLIYPVVTAVHSAGAAWGLLSGPEAFETTEKTTREDEED